MDGRRKWEEQPPARRFMADIAGVAFAVVMVMLVWAGVGTSSGGSGWVAIVALCVGAGFGHDALNTWPRVRNGSNNMPTDDR
jgi:hypothetical protein